MQRHYDNNVMSKVPLGFDPCAGLDGTPVTFAATSAIRSCVWRKAAAAQHITNEV